MSLKTASNQYVELVETKPDIILRGESLDELPAQVLSRLKERLQEFPRLLIEIGSGSGNHLVERARKNPDMLCIGFEIRYKRVFRTAEKAELAGLRNLIVIQADGKLFTSLFSPESIDELYLLFPDPWEKRRWRKHRMINPAFLGTAHTLLKPAGTFTYKTDHREYFEHSMKLIHEYGRFSIISLSPDAKTGTITEEDPNFESEFEKLFKYKQLPIYMVKLQK